MKRLAMLLLVVLPAPAGALQATDGWRDSALRVVAHYDSLRSERVSAFHAARAALRSGGDWIDIHEGAFTMRVIPRLAARARAGARLATEVVDRRGGPALRTRLATRTPVFGADTGWARFGHRAVTWFRDDTMRISSPRVSIATIRPATAADFRDALLTLAEVAALAGTDSVLRGWGVGSRLPLRDAPRERWSRAYVELVTTASASLRRCLGRDTAACLTSLGVEPPSGSRLDAWYDPGDYRDVLQHVAVRHADSSAVASAKRCRATGAPEACARAARAIPEVNVPLPLSPPTRQLFLGEVLRSGGSGAYARLVATHGTLAQRLRAAAGVPLDTVVTRWMVRLDAARESEMAIMPGTVAFTLAWCGLFIGIAIMRRGAWN